MNQKIVIAVLAFLFPICVGATTYTVSSNADTNTAGTLRNAINLSNNDTAGPNIIEFNSGLGIVTLTSHLPHITQPVTIQPVTTGTLTVDGASLYRSFFFESTNGLLTPVTASISNVVVNNGNATGGSGGGAAGGGMGAGPALFVKTGTTVTVTNFQANTCSAVGGAGGASVASSRGGGGGGGLGGNGGSSTGVGTGGGGGGGGTGGNGGNASARGGGGGGGARGSGASAQSNNTGGGGGGGGGDDGSGGLSTGAPPPANSRAGTGGGGKYSEVASANGGTGFTVAAGGGGSGGGGATGNGFGPAGGAGGAGSGGAAGGVGVAAGMAGGPGEGGGGGGGSGGAGGAGGSNPTLNTGGGGGGGGNAISIGGDGGIGGYGSGGGGGGVAQGPGSVRGGDGGSGGGGARGGGGGGGGGVNSGGGLGGDGGAGTINGGGGGAGASFGPVSTPGLPGMGGFGGGGGGGALGGPVGSIGGAGGFGGGAGGTSAKGGAAPDIVGAGGGFGGGGAGGYGATGTGGAGGFSSGSGSLGAVNTSGAGGGGGALGGAIFVQDGGTLILVDPMFSGNSVVGGAAGGVGATAGSSSGTDLFIMSAGSVTIDTTIPLTITTDIASDNGAGGGSTATGGLVKTGASILALSGVNTYTGSTTITAGTLQVSADTNLGAGTATIAMNGGTLTPTASFTSSRGMSVMGVGSSIQVPTGVTFTYAGAMSGAADLMKTDVGLLSVTGASPAFTGTLVHTAGEVNMNGSIGGGVTGSSGSIFSGNATLGGTLTNSGTVSVGNSVGIMNVAALVLTPTSILNTEIADDLTNDLIVVSGAATLDGTMNVIFLPGVYLPGYTYTVITAAGGVSGAFSSSPDNNAQFDIRVINTGNQVILTVIDPFDNVFFMLNFSGNALAVKNNLTDIFTAGTLTGDLRDVVLTFTGQSEATITDALLRMDPTPYTTLGSATAMISQELAEFFGGKTRKSCCPGNFGCEDGKWGIWADPFKMNIRQSSFADQEGFKANATGVVVGVEKGLNREWKFGFGGAYDHLDVCWDHNRGHSHSNNIYGAVFCDQEGRRHHFSLALLGGCDFFSNERKIKFTSIDRTAKSDYLAGELIGEVSGAIFMGPEDCRLNFYATIDSDTLFQPTFQEKGADSLSLDVKSNASSVLVSEAGVLFKWRQNKFGGCWGPDLWASFVNETFITGGSIQSEFFQQVIPFTTVGVRRTQYLLELGATLSFLVDNRFTFSASYSPQFGAHLFTQRGDFRLRWLF